VLRIRAQGLSIGELFIAVDYVILCVSILCNLTSKNTLHCLHQLKRIEPGLLDREPTILCVVRKAIQAKICSSVRTHPNTVLFVFCLYMFLNLLYITSALFICQNEVTVKHLVYPSLFIYKEEDDDGFEVKVVGMHAFLSFSELQLRLPAMFVI